MAETRNPSTARCGELLRRNVTERKVRLQIFHRLAVHLRVGIDKVIQGIALVLGREADVTAVGEENAIGVVRAEEEVTLSGILPGFGSIHRYPTDAAKIKFSPAMLAVDVAFGLAFV